MTQPRTDTVASIHNLQSPASVRRRRLGRGEMLVKPADHPRQYVELVLLLARPVRLSRIHHQFSSVSAVSGALARYSDVLAGELPP
jgi:hypothetical protein